MRWNNPKNWLSRPSKEESRGLPIVLQAVLIGVFGLMALYGMFSSLIHIAAYTEIFGTEQDETAVMLRISSTGGRGGSTKYFEMVGLSGRKYQAWPTSEELRVYKPGDTLAIRYNKYFSNSAYIKNNRHLIMRSTINLFLWGLVSVVALFSVKRKKYFEMVKDKVFPSNQK